MPFHACKPLNKISRGFAYIVLLDPPPISVAFGFFLCTSRIRGRSFVLGLLLKLSFSSSLWFHVRQYFLLLLPSVVSDCTLFCGLFLSISKYSAGIYLQKVDLNKTRRYVYLAGFIDRSILCVLLKKYIKVSWSSQIIIVFPCKIGRAHV